jgi:hypothetical protein
LIGRGRPARQRREDCVHSAKPRVASSGSAQHALATAAGGVFHVVRSSSCVTPPAAMVKPSLRRPQEDPLQIRLPFCVKKRSRSDSIRARRRGLRAVILSRPWRAHSQLIGTVPADRPRCWTSRLTLQRLEWAGSRFTGAQLGRRGGLVRRRRSGLLAVGGRLAGSAPS